MPGKFAEDVPIIPIGQGEQVCVSFEDGNVEFRPTRDNKFIVRGAMADTDFVICRGRVYVVENSCNRSLGVCQSAYVIESYYRRLVIEGTPKGFRVTEPIDRASNHNVRGNVRNCQFLEIAGVLIRAQIEF